MQFGKGRSDRVEKMKLQEMKTELRMLLNEITPLLHPGSEQHRKVRRFMEEHYLIPMDQKPTSFERTMQRL